MFKKNLKKEREGIDKKTHMYINSSRTNIPNTTFTMSMIKPDIIRYLKN